MHTEKMKRKVAKVGRLRLSPNEESLLLREELDRRRKLRLQQVREQERYIALQIRQDVKQRRDEQLQLLAEELKAVWQKAQTEKLRAMERLYQTGLKAVGEAHQQAKENEPDLKAIENQVAMRKQKAEKRHRIALKELKQQKEKEVTEQTRHIKARQRALQAEKERATKIAGLPPPPPDPLVMIEEMKRIPTVKVCNVDSFSVTHYHLLEPYVDKEMDTEQPDARLAAEEEAKRMDDLQKDDARERREQFEKARLRGNHALKIVHLAQDQEKLLKELEQMQCMDLARRRQIVAQMPPQLFEPAYRRAEIKEDWQRELEFAFEDLYTEDLKVKGEMILHLEPEPLPAPSVQTKDEDLDLTMEPDRGLDAQQPADDRVEEVTSDSVPAAKESTQPPSNLVLKKLLNKIRTQKKHWMSKIEAETLSETIESGSIPVEERRDGSSAEHKGEQEHHCDTPPIEPPQLADSTVVAGRSILLHPQEKAMRIRIAANRQKQLEAIEQQKQQQLALLQQLELEKLKAEAEFLELQLQMQKNKTREMEDQVQMNMKLVLHQNEEMEQENEKPTVPENKLKEEDHLQMIRNYQHHLLLQNRQHQQSVEEARKRLQEYQVFLKKRYPAVSTAPLDSAAMTASEYVNEKYTTETSLQTEASEMLHSKVHSVAHEPSKQIHSHDQHAKALEEARKQLLEYQAMLRTNYPHICRTALDSVITKETASRNQESKIEPFLQGDAVEMLHSSCVKDSVLLPERQEPVNSHSGKPVFVEQQSENIDQAPVAGSSRESPAVFHSMHDCFQKALQSSNLSQLMPVGVLDASSDAEVKQLPMSGGQMDSICLRIPQEVQGEMIGLRLPIKNNDQSTVQKSPNSPKAQVLKWVPETLESQGGQAKTIDALDYGRVPVQDNRDAPLELSTSQPFLLSVVEQQLCSLSHDHSTEPGGIQEHKTQKSFSNVLEFRERFLSTEEIQAQQERVKELQSQLDWQKQALVSRKKIQDELLLQKRNELKQRQQETMEGFLGDEKAIQTSFPVEMSVGQKNEQFDWMSSILHALENNEHKKADHISKNESQTVLGREQRWRPLKPPVAKTKLGLVLEPHELSTIPETESPKSGRSSALGKKTASEEESSLLSAVGDADSSISPLGESDLSRISTSSKDQNSSALARDCSSHSSRLSWRERLMLDAGILHDSDQCRDSIVVQDLPNYAVDISRGVLQYPDSQCRPKNQAVLSQASLTTVLSPQICIQDAVSEHMSSTTISSGSILTNERLESSPSNIEGSSYHSDIRPCPDSSSKEATNDGLSLSASPSSLHAWQEIMSHDRETQLPSQRSRSHIQQIIDKYTKDLNWPFEGNVSWHAPTVGIDFSYIDQNSFQPQCFRPLEPRSDFDISSLSCEQSQKFRNSEDTVELSKDSVVSKKSQDVSLVHESTVSSLQGNSNGMDSLSFGTIKSYSFALSMDGSSKESIPHDYSGSFHQLQPETTLSEQNLIPGAMIAGQSCEPSTENQNRVTEKEFVPLPTAERAEELGYTENLPSLQSSVESLRSQNPCSFEEIGSFYELRETQDLVNDSLLSEHPVRGCIEFTKESSCSFEELPALKTEQADGAQDGLGINLKQNIDMKAHRFADKSESYSLSEGWISAFQSLCRTPEQANLETSTDLEAKVVQSRCLSRTIGPSITISSGTCSLQSSIPIWDTESGHGIMEEPELTLISLNDSTVTVLDFAHTNQEENRESKINNLACTADDPEFRSSSRSGFLPLLPEVDNSIFSGLDSVTDHCSTANHSSSQQFAVMQLDFASSPGSLQDAFLKRKIDFIEKSRKRLEGIKKRGETFGKMGTIDTPKSGTEESQLPRECSPSGGAAQAGCQLKKIGEVRVCTPEDRNSMEAQMYQRTLRLYNQLNEVKIRKEEKARQESYAKNREKAKVFQKKTLQKLRTKK